MPGDEISGRRLGANDIYDVVAVKISGMTQEGFLSVVVVLFLEFEFPVEPAVGLPGNHGRKGPAGEGPRALPDIVFGIVAHAHAEQLQQLPAPILVDRV